VEVRRREREVALKWETLYDLDRIKGEESPGARLAAAETLIAGYSCNDLPRRAAGAL
jgi:hypothetical protein